MRPAIRLLAQVSKPGPQFLEPGAPTGLTGLFTHSSPRSTLLYLYSSTLEKLKQFPEHSVYRQSTEALTRHRLQIIEQTKPAGLEEWQARVKALVDEHPRAFRQLPASQAGASVSTPASSKAATGGTDQAFNIIFKQHGIEGMKTKEWGDEYVARGQSQGAQARRMEDFNFPRSSSEPHVLEAIKQEVEKDQEAARIVIPRIEPEPALTADQIGEVENQLQAGLIEEVISVAEAENELVNVMMECKAYVFPAYAPFLSHPFA